jgi:hypothetical protein
MPILQKQTAHQVRLCVSSGALKLLTLLGYGMSQLCHPPSGKGLRHSYYPGVAGPFQRSNDYDLYTRACEKQSGYKEPSGPVTPMNGLRRPGFPFSARASGNSGAGQEENGGRQLSGRKQRIVTGNVPEMQNFVKDTKRLPRCSIMWRTDCGDDEPARLRRSQRL